MKSSRGVLPQVFFGQIESISVGRRIFRTRVSAGIKNNIRRTARSLGVDVIRWRPQSSPDAALAKMLAHHRIDTVLDVGANEGQYARLLREIGYRGRIVSFEPLSTVYQRLQEVAAHDPLWIVAPRTAIGNQEGTVRINVASNNGASSSILPMLQAHQHAAPQVAYVGFEIAPIAPLDCAASDFLGDGQNIFLKADVQGFELEVLQGAAELLHKIAGIQLEVSLVPLYEGQALFSTLIDRVRRDGFSVWGILPGLVDGSSGRLLQADVIFFRN
jgi:FkbM family methyltransferase